MPKRKFLRWRGNRKLYLAVIILALLFLFHYTGPLRIAERKLFLFFKTVNGFAYSVGAHLRPSVSSEIAPEDLRADNNKLREEAARLAIEAARVHEVEEENQKLRQSIQFFSDHQYKKVFANVVAQEFSAQTGESGRSIIIDKGVRDGLSVGLGVIDPIGQVVGKVVEVSDYSGRVCLVTSGGCKLAATIQNDDKTIGVSEGDLGLTVKMSFIPQTEKVNNGDLVVTSGLGEIIPRGLVLGKVTSVASSSNDIWQTATIAPLLDLGGLTIVSVIIP